MVTTPAPSVPEDPRRLPASLLLQRLMRADPRGEGPGGGPRPAPKRARRRKGEMRPAASSGRYQQHQHHRAGLRRRGSAQETRRPDGAPPASPEPGLRAGQAEEAAPTSASVSGPRGKESLKNKMGKSEKAAIPYNQSVHSLHLCEQSKINRQRSKWNLQLNKIPPAKKSESNFWQESVSSELIKKQEEKTVKNTENGKNMISRKPTSLTEENQKENYAGTKFSEPPSPSVLPKPPSHWVGSPVQYSDQNREMMAVHLKTLLKVQA